MIQADMAEPKERRKPERPILITGGAGFIGTNLAERLAAAGSPVLIFDSLRRSGVEANLDWLRRRHTEQITAEIADIRDPDAVRAAVARCGAIFHFAAQVAVTTSISDPLEDFEINARGTLNVLEAMRALPAPPPLIFTSTNKVYGRLSGLTFEPRERRYAPADPAVDRFGISELHPLDFHSPYGCSKGAADQYVLDYARTYQLPATVFRMSCIYGPHQWGTEDQGWVAHFLIRFLAGEPITLYGDGRQVRDILYVDDLIDALLLARRHIDRLSGRAFNIGGGPTQAVSLLELLGMVEELARGAPELRYGPVRAGDQEYYVSDIRTFAGMTGWRPRVGVGEGVGRLYRWMQEERPALPGPSPREAAGR